jgi:hypothetical protein
MNMIITVKTETFDGINQSLGLAGKPETQFGLIKFWGDCTAIM